MAMMKGSTGKGGGKGKAGKGSGTKGTKKPRQPREPDPAGSGRVFARGFDFGTTDEQFEEHMSSLGGQILNVYWVTKGSAVVVYKTKKMAKQAVDQLNGATIEGNSRFMDVMAREDKA